MSEKTTPRTRTEVKSCGDEGNAKQRLKAGIKKRQDQEVKAKNGSKEEGRLGGHFAVVRGQHASQLLLWESQHKYKKTTEKLTFPLPHHEKKQRFFE